MIHQSGSILLLGTRACSRIVRTKENIQKVKNRFVPKTEGISSKILVGASATSVRRILKIYLRLKLYKKIIDSSLFTDQKIKLKQFANWFRTNF